ncbi:hypothetical protein N7535_008067 [Penicillium sp. DV-2018c]|nr:hypothetical protein N7461_004104 [Penicillium sp. DV-2018c]KAJ5566429.1 hypothetical protein N7535_008067 [Penicillium sp. DV-2018c]
MTGTKKPTKLPEDFRAWHDRLLEMAHQSKYEISASVIAHIEKPSIHDFSNLDPCHRTLAQAEKTYNIKPALGYQNWQFPSIRVSLEAGFCNCYHSPTCYGSMLIMTSWLDRRNQPLAEIYEWVTEAALRLDAFIVAVYYSLSAQGLLRDAAGTRVTLDLLGPTSEGPVLEQKLPRSCTGTADYSLLLGEEGHLASHLVIIETEIRGRFPDKGHILAYMAMVQANRRSKRHTDWTTWGVVSDGWDFHFYQLNMEGEWSFLPLQGMREDWQAIADMLGSIVLHAQRACNSPVRPSLSPDKAPASEPQSAASATPRIGFLKVIPMKKFMSEFTDTVDVVSLTLE